MLGFVSVDKKRLAAALADLRAMRPDLLALSRDDIDAAATRHRLGKAGRVRLLQQLVADAIDRDVHRLIAHYRASGRAVMPPPRLIGAWATALGAALPILSSDEPGVTLAQEYLAVGRIDVQQHCALKDVAVAYGAPAAAALRWIEAAVSAEIDRRAEGIAPRRCWWRRLAGSPAR